MELKRLAGILLHPTSLPGKYGIGDLGQSAVDFVDFLKKSNQKIWQVLPLSPTSFGDSPYQSFSTFAGNSLLISPDELVKEGYLSGIFEVPQFDPVCIDYGKVIEFKTKLLKEAFSGFKEKSTDEQRSALHTFCEQNAFWLKDYTIFIALKEFFIKKRKEDGFTSEYDEFKKKCEGYLDENAINDYYFGGAWVSWPKDLMLKNDSAIRSVRKQVEGEVEFHAFLQYEFFRQWTNIKKHANESGISIIGDLPIFIAYDSADCWANKKLFHLDEKGFPIDVAGVPPDYFSKTGQLWGNPLYSWEALYETNYQWWINRIKKATEACDFIRIDHFRGFDTYWSVPFGEKTAINGKWKTGPRTKLFDAIRQSLGDLPIIAEDLGEMFDSVYELKDHYNLPGMKVLQFAFDDTNRNDFLPHNYKNTNSVVYTGTHDNDTTIGWFSKATPKAKDYVRRYLNIDGSDISWDLIKLAYSSVSSFAIIPMQDCLMLGTESRMNFPGVANGNWKWRFTNDMLKENISGGLKYLTELYARDDQPVPEGLPSPEDIKAEKVEGAGAQKKNDENVEKEQKEIIIVSAEETVQKETETKNSAKED